MKRKTFLQSLIVLGWIPSLISAKSSKMEKTGLTLLRHATLMLEIGGKKILIDPMFSDKNDMDPIGNCGYEIRIPMVDLPFSKSGIEAMVSQVDAICVTHLHRDHWDEAAQNSIAKDKLIFCSLNDVQTIRGQGFTNVRSIEGSVEWNAIQIHRTGGQHGTGEVGKSMGAVSGFVFINGQDSIYVAGDTIWCEEVAQALTQFDPEVTVLNAGGAKFLIGGPITMTTDDIIKVHEKSPRTKIIAVHMDTVNHCFLTRKVLLRELTAMEMESTVLIPADGQRMELF